MSEQPLRVWNYPTRIVFGESAIRCLDQELPRLALKRVLLVTDPGVQRAGLAQRVAARIQALGIELEAFTGISTNPTEEEVEAGAEVYRRFGAEGVVAVGGGAPMDTAKLILVRDATAAPWEQLDDAKGGDQLIPAQLAPSIAIPTTAGTGSEVGRAAVLTVRATRKKTVIFSPAMLPRVAILDPGLTLGLPSQVTATTGFDALTHCLEAYLSLGDHPIADSIALGGLELVARSLEQAVNSGQDWAARADMMKAASMGAAAFQKGLGACHSLAHPLSAECGLHHGLANALCLPSVVDFNEQAVPERVARVAQIFGASGDPGSCAHALRALRTRVGIAGGLGALGVDENQLGRLAELAFEDACHQSNPRPCSTADLRRLYASSL